MLKIGEFARLSQVSVVTLRYYDEIGLLPPDTIDAESGYRYYSIRQLPIIHRILALKDLGFSLDQIKDMLDGITLEQLQGMLKLKQAEVARRVSEDQERLAQIEARLRLIEMENKMPDYDVVLKTVPTMLVAARKVTIPTNDLVPEYLSPAFDETFAFVRQGGAKVSSPCFALWHSPADVYVNEVVEAVVPIDRTLQETKRVKVYELSEVQVVSVVHQGHFDDFTQGHTALLKWIEENNYKITGPYREIYIQYDPDRLEDSTTEIQFPVEES